MKGIVLLIALEIIKEQNESLKESICFNLIESMIIHCIVQELYDNVIKLSDEETSLILISSEYARIHRRT